MPIVIGAKRESNFTDPIGMLGDCHRRIEMFLNVLVRVAEQAQGEALNEEQRGALDTALRYFREAARKHTADEEESLFPGSVGSKVPKCERSWLESSHWKRNTSVPIEATVRSTILGKLWLSGGKAAPGTGVESLALLIQLRDLYRHHIATEDNEVFPTAAAALSAADREAIGGEMASRRSISRGQSRDSRCRRN